MQKQTTYTYQLSLEDIKEALEEYMLKKGEHVTIKDMEVMNRTEEIPRGMFDCDYVYIFNGIKFKGEMY